MPSCRRCADEIVLQGVGEAATVCPHTGELCRPMKLTPAQVAMMRNELAGRNICAGLSGRSAHGGATWTMQALLRKGLLRRAGGLTPTGEAALRAHDSKVPNGISTSAQQSVTRREIISKSS